MRLWRPNLLCRFLHRDEATAKPSVVPHSAELTNTFHFIGKVTRWPSFRHTKKGTVTRSRICSKECWYLWFLSSQVLGGLLALSGGGSYATYKEGWYHSCAWYTLHVWFQRMSVLCAALLLKWPLFFLTDYCAGIPFCDRCRVFRSKLTFRSGDIDL